MISTIGSIAAGGALGALARHGVNVGAVKMLGLGFPYGTMIVNIVGSMMIGGLITIFAQVWQPPESVKLFLITGFLGGFTTFSAFSLDAISLLERQAYSAAILYIIGSVVLSLLAVFAAMIAMREVLS